MCRRHLLQALVQGRPLDLNRLLESTDGGEPVCSLDEGIWTQIEEAVAAAGVEVESEGKGLETAVLRELLGESVDMQYAEKPELQRMEEGMWPVCHVACLPVHLIVWFSAVVFWVFGL